MSEKKPATANSTRPDLTTFYVPKERIIPVLQAVVNLQNRDDLSGKFSRKLTFIRRAFSAAHEALDEERFALVKAGAERYPVGHEKAGEFTPVYDTNTPDGSPKRKLDESGNPTGELIVIPNQYNLKDPAAFGVEWKAVIREVVEITCPCIKVAEIEAFQKIRGNITDSLVDIEEGADTTRKPEGWDDAHKPALELVKDEPEAPTPPAVEETADSRSAP